MVATDRISAVAHIDQLCNLYSLRHVTLMMYTLHIIYGFTCATLCCAGTSYDHVSVSAPVCVCLSQFGVLLKRLNESS